MWLIIIVKISSLRQRGPALGFNNPFYRNKSFASKESDTKILQSIYFAYEVGIISSYSNIIFFQ